MMKAITLLCILTLDAVDAFSVQRREMLSTSGMAIVGAVVGTVTQPANAINACPPRSNNCIRTTWTVPEGSAKNIAQSMETILNSYPQEGQADVDLGGWTLVENNLQSTGKARVEYSSGVGKFAKFFNGGKPFIDDLEVEIVGDNKIELRSASRVGDSDFDVNKKRLLFLGGKAKALGWNVPDPTY
jgi:hypothetical protein